MTSINRVASAAFIALSVFSAQLSYAQSAPQRAPMGMEGAGGSGGSGGGAAVPHGTIVTQSAVVNRNPAYVTRVRSAEPPALDPTRKVHEVDCTRPFEFLGRGNLRCM
jgi:hypothetical protein